jgi:hypothetical protein
VRGCRHGIESGGFTDIHRTTGHRLCEVGAAGEADDGDGEPLLGEEALLGGDLRRQRVHEVLPLHEPEGERNGRLRAAAGCGGRRGGRPT